MGLFKIVGSTNNIYILYHIKEGNKEIEVYTLDQSENSFYVKLNCDSIVVRKWAQNLQQTTENYILQLSSALKEQTFQKENYINSIDENNSTQNIFEIDGENLVWKQFFKSKNIYGKKGKFSLEEKGRGDALTLSLDALIEELSEKDKLVEGLQKENENLVKEKEELRKIAEDSVLMKENFEKEIYGKFAHILNEKKEKNLELRKQLERTRNGGTREKHTRPEKSSYGVSEREEYEDDTDVDSPEEVDEDGSDTFLKRRGGGPSHDDEIASKKSRNFISDSPESSQDLLDQSLESDFQSIQFSKKVPRRVF